MNITFCLELNTSNHSSNVGSVLIRCTQNRKHKRISTGVTLEYKYWDKVHHKVRKSHPMAEEFNQLLLEKLKKITSIYIKLLSESDTVTLEDIVIKSTSGDSILNFFDFAYSTKMAEIKGNNKPGTYRRYEAVFLHI